MLALVEAISREFTDTILGGASIGQVVQQLAGIAANPVILENAAHQVVDFAVGSQAQAAAILPGWYEHSRSGHAELQPGRVHREGGPPRCTWAGIATPVDSTLRLNPPRHASWAMLFAT